MNITNWIVLVILIIVILFFMNKDKFESFVIFNRNRRPYLYFPGLYSPYKAQYYNTIL